MKRKRANVDIKPENNQSMIKRWQMEKFSSLYIPKKGVFST